MKSWIRELSTNQYCRFTLQNCGIRPLHKVAYVIYNYIGVLNPKFTLFRAGFASASAKADLRVFAGV
jgi:hypothetical protein